MVYADFVASLGRSCNTPRHIYLFLQHLFQGFWAAQKLSHTMHCHPVGLSPFPLPRTECTPGNYSLRPFKSSSGRHLSYTPCATSHGQVLSPLVGCSAPAPDSGLRHKPHNLLWPTERGGSNGGSLGSLAQETYSNHSFPSPWEQAQAGWLEYERPMKLSHITTLTQDKPNLDQLVASHPSGT